MRVILIILLVLVTRNVLADEVNEYVAIKCSDHSADLITGFINNSPSFNNTWPPQDYKLNLEGCRIKPGIRISVIVIEDKQSLRGACGLNPEQEIVVTTNELIAYKGLLSPKCGGLMIKSIRITSKSISICKYIEVSHATPWTATIEPEYQCSEMPHSK